MAKQSDQWKKVGNLSGFLLTWLSNLLKVPEGGMKNKRLGKEKGQRFKFLTA